MLEYNDLNDDEKRVLRDALGVERIYTFYLEDHHILLMDSKELFEYIYILDVKKKKDALQLIEKIGDSVISSNDVNKTVIQKIIEEKENVIVLGNNRYAYRE